MTVSMDLETQTNADFSLALAYLANTVAVDLTGSVLSMMVRAHAPDRQVFASIDNGDIGGVDIEDAVNGLFNILVPEQTLNKMPPGPYVYDIIRLRPDGLREPVLSGTIAHTIGVTR
jgi:hypothetical protein